MDVLVEATRNKDVNSEEQLRLAVEASGMGTFDWDIARNDFRWSQRCREIIGFRPGTEINRAFFDSLIHEQDAAKVTAARAAASDPDGGGEYRATHRIRRMDGAIRWITMRGKIIFNTGYPRTPTRFIGTVVDVTEHLEAEMSQRAEAARARIAMAAAGLIAWEYDPDTNLLISDPRMADLLGLDGAPPFNMSHILGRIHPEDIDQVSRLFDRALVSGETFRAEFRVVRPDGSFRWLMSSSEVLTRADGSVMIIGYSADITDQKIATRTLQDALDAKEVLLNEVNHRVKNSLQVVASLIALQSRQVHDERARASLDEVQSRLSVVASLHQRLYMTGKHDRVDFAAYLSDLAAETLRGLAADERITVETRTGEPVTVFLSQASPLALITGELITNVVKYAYSKDERGTLRLAVTRDGDMMKMIVADDGKGLPENFLAANTPGIGMKIVSALLRQLRGRMSTLPQEKGACFQIMIPLSAAE